MLFLPVCCAADGKREEPLTLLNKPQQAIPSNQQQNKNNIQELRDIQGPVPISEPLPYILLLGGSLATLLLLAAIFWVMRKRKKPDPPPIPAWEQALQDIANAKKLLTPERGLLYMDRASQILRRYIESRFSIQSTRQTTREFLQGLKTVGADSPLQTYRNELQLCLEQADMAKFAHHIPDLNNLELMENAVITFVKRTEPTQVPKGGSR